MTSYCASSCPWWRPVVPVLVLRVLGGVLVLLVPLSVLVSVRAGVLLLRVLVPVVALRILRRARTARAAARAGASVGRCGGVLVSVVPGVLLSPVWGAWWGFRGFYSVPVAKISRATVAMIAPASALVRLSAYAPASSSRFTVASSPMWSIMRSVSASRSATRT